MAAQIILLKDFLGQLRSKDEIISPFTWFVGSEISIKSGIPVLSKITRIVVLFEYMYCNKNIIFNETSNISSHYEFNCIKKFFTWYEESNKDQSDYFDELLDQSIHWLFNQKEFQGVSIDSCQCYQLVFEYFLKDNNKRRCFLFNLVNRVERTNIVYIGLAGLLKDYPQLGCTVFTTCFDDYLLKSINRISCSAQIVNDFHSLENHFLMPELPQILYIYGNYINYEFEALECQKKFEKPDFEARFLEQTSNSNLLILGSLKWDKIIVRMIEKWDKLSSSHDKKLYWILDENELSNVSEIKNILDTLQSDRVYIVKSDESPLNAEYFLLSLCDEINRDNGGFEYYRGSILNSAKKQHNFLLKQLESYPDFHPNKALEILEGAKNIYKQGNAKEAEAKKNFAESLICADDVPDTLKGRAFREISIIEVMLGNFSEADSALNKALLVWKKLESDYPTAKIESANTIRALGELYLKLGDIEESKETFKKAYIAYSEIDSHYGIALTKRFLAEISLRESKLDKAKEHIDVGEKSLTQVDKEKDSISIEASFARVVGDYYLLRGDRRKAIEKYKIAQKIFEDLEDDLGIANILKCLGDVHTRNLDFGKAYTCFNQARNKYEIELHVLGIANTENALGDLKMQLGQYEDALKCYEKSIYYYRKIDAKHGISNALADVFKCLSKVPEFYSDSDIQDELKDRIKLKELVSLCGNAYARKTIGLS